MGPCPLDPLKHTVPMYLSKRLHILTTRMLVMINHAIVGTSDSRFALTDTGKKTQHASVALFLLQRLLSS